MVRLSLKYTENKTYEWKVLKTEKPALLTIVTNQGEVTIRNHPYAFQGSRLFKSWDFKSTYVPDYYAKLFKKYPFLSFLWFDRGTDQVFNPVYRQWMEMKFDPESEIFHATLDILEYDFIEYVAKFIPQINAMVAAHVAEHVSVEKTFCAMESEVKLSKTNP